MTRVLEEMGFLYTSVLAMVLVLYPASRAIAESTPEEEVARQFGVSIVDSLGQTPNLADYEGFALGNNQKLAADLASWKAASLRGDAAGALPNPKFTWSEAIVPVETRVGPQERIFGLTQQVPWFGTLGLRRDVEDERALAAQSQVESTVLSVLMEVRTAYHELVYLDRSIETTANHLTLLKQWESVALSRYETGKGQYSHVLKAQVEIGLLEDRWATLRDRRLPMVARLNAALGRSEGVPVLVSQEIQDPGDLDAEVLRSRVLTGNPDLAKIEHQAASHFNSGRLAGKSRYPGLSLGLNYIMIGPAPTEGVADSGRDAIFAAVGVSVPLWRGSYDAAEKTAEGNYRAAAHLRTDLGSRLVTALEQAIYEYDDARRKADLYRHTLLPKARQSMGAVRSAYETGQADFLDMIDAQRVLLEFELTLHRASVDILIQLSQIDRLAGGGVYRPLPGTPTIDDRED